MGVAVSGQGIPELPGYRLVFADEFDGDRDTSSWSGYQGQPKGRPQARWRRDHLLCHDSRMLLRTTFTEGLWTSGGTSNARAGTQTGGAWAFRFRARPAAGIGYAFLLYPGGGGWPPEVDLVEDFGGERRRFRTTVHWSDPTTGRHEQKGWAVEHDQTAWTTVVARIDPGRFTVDVEGVRVLDWDGTLDDGTPVPWAVPDSLPLWFGMQAHAADGATDETTPPVSDVEVDWVARYARLD
ncbi:hypothetical protein ACFQ46_23660 [Kineococcus sp. GCM10028916]|uniref:hypothetical protein n=1 Tax=Kineococcus sp. GCM10028916 TaxID=3273394 RepID=UPI00362AC561